MALIYNASFDSTTRVLSLLDKAGNVISSCEVPSKSNELTLTATADNSSVKLHKQDSSSVLANTYEVNTGSGWEAYTFDTVINLNAGDRCRWRCSSHTTEQTGLSGYVGFVMTGSIEASGNINSMLSSDYKNITSLAGHAYVFYGLFKGCKSLVDVTKLKLPATTLETHCYDYLFYGCSAITTPPELPATTIVASCYTKAFSGCSTLTQTPDLAASTLPNACYENMFSSCGSLTKIYLGATSAGTRSIINWQPAASGDIYCDPNFTLSGISNITNWNRWIYGATDTGETTTMYRRGVAETVMIGTSSYGACYSAQGWAGFKTLSEMYGLGYTFGAQTAVTLYHEGSPVSTYFCDANQDDGFTETMYYVEGAWVDSATAYMDGYYPEDFIKPLMFKSKTSNATISTNATNLDVSRNMTDWDAYTANTALPVGVDECVYFRANTNGVSGTKFTLSGNFEAGGNILSVYRTDFTTHSGQGLNFSEMFKNQTGLLKAPMLTPTYIDTTKYNSMFEGCTGLEEDAPLPPVLTFAGISSPYSNLGYYFYNMYKGCTGLLRIRSFQNYESATVSGGSYGLGTCLTLATYGMFLSIGTGVTRDMYQSVKLPVVLFISSGTIHDTHMGSASIETIPEPFYLKHTQDWNLSLISENYGGSMPSGAFGLNSSSAYYEYSYNRVDWFSTASYATPVPSQIPANTKIYIRKYHYAPSYIYMYNAGTSTSPNWKTVYGGAGLCAQRGFYFAEDCEVGGDIRSLDSANYYEQQPYAQNLQSLFSCVMKRNGAIYASYPCTGLTKSLNLSASSYGYLDYMYYGCSSLNEVRINATNVTSLTDWLKGVAASGTVYANSSLSLPTNSTSGVPSGWTRLPLSDYPTT